MTKIEMLNEWKKASAIKQEFCKAFGERFPHMCYTSPELLKRVLGELESLIAELAKVADGEPDKAVKAKKAEPKEEKAKPEGKAKAKKESKKEDKTGKDEGKEAA